MPITTLSARVSTRLCPFGVNHCKLAAPLEKAAGAGFREAVLLILHASTPKRSGWQGRALGSRMPGQPHVAPLRRGFAVESDKFNSLYCISDGKEGYGR